MQYLIMVLVVEALVSVAGATGGVTEDASMDLQQDGTPSSELEVIEVFRAETPEELEATLADGYPPAWLEEILTDESIPEEDRYWLDCRVRAVIAQDLHLFFNEVGEPVHIRADWIAPGEDYWRENFMVNPIGEPFLYDSPDLPTNVVSEPGILLNRFGEEVGHLAMTSRNVRLSRDGSIGVTSTGILPLPGCPVRPIAQSSYACLLYSDGSFREIPIGYSETGFFQISNDGSTIVALSYIPSDSTGVVEEGGLLWIFDKDGILQHQYRMPAHPFTSPAVSASGRYVACQQYPLPAAGVYLIDGYSGELIHQFEDDIFGHYLSFTPNERYLCMGGLQRLLVYDCEMFQEVWTTATSNYISRYRSIDSDNSAHIAGLQIFNGPLEGFSLDVWDLQRMEIIYTEDMRGNIQVSPSGSIVVAQTYGPVTRFGSNGSSLPIIVTCLMGGE
jgi:hypothetical protein